MVSILEKSEHNVDFHPIVDFIEASFHRYALTIKPTVYVSHIRQFWSTAMIKTAEEGTQILATVDRIHRTITESSLRRNLKLKEEGGISSLPDTELFENLTVMGYNISLNQKFTFQKAPRVTSPAAAEGSMKQTINDGFVVKLLEDRQGVAASIDDAPIKGRNLDEGEAAAERASNDTEEMATVLTSINAATILASRAAEVPTSSGSIPTAERSGDDAPIKGRSLDEREAAVERTSDDTEEMATVLTSMDATTVLASGAAEVPTGSGSIPTAGPPAAEVPTGSDVVPTASLVFATATVEYHQFASELPNERRIELISDLVKNNLGWKVKDFRGMTFEEVEAKFNSVWKQMEDFIPIGSKEEAERIKRKGLSLEQESAKKQKTSKEVTEEAKSSDEVPEEKVKEMMQLVPIEEVYVEALQVKHPIIDWKNLMHAPVEWKLYDSCGVHHVTSKDKEIFMLVEKDYPLKKVLALVMISYKLQVENYSQMASDLILKIYKDCKFSKTARNEMHKAFPLPGIEFPLAKEVPTASEEGCHCQKKRDATARKIALLSNSRRICQSKSNDSFTKLVPHVTSCILGITITITSCTRTPCPRKGVI
uniref:Xylulose kinase-1 n=1 Tax=Tanacetum cinerariifolium TaxID=118510 RepID=A0A6L2KKJ9_TANCI|nr:hypothetical protein [Tanacetum cinerariifolium]